MDYQLFVLNISFKLVLTNKSFYTIQVFSFITLIPKVGDPRFPKNFQLSRLIGNQYKIIAKILANRLANMVDLVVGMVGMDQSTFIVNLYKRKTYFRWTSYDELR